MKWIFLAVILLFGQIACAPKDGRGPFERAGASIDRTAERTVEGAKKVTQKVASAVRSAADWVEEEVVPSPTPTPSVEADAGLMDRY